jgi:SAM-dependent methyltransferase
VVDGVHSDCRLCGGRARARFVCDRFVVHRCHACDLEFVWPEVPDAVLRAVYERGYFTGAGPGYSDYFGRERDLSLRKASARLDVMESIVPSRGRLLDVGCAAGYFVEAAMARGWDAYGTETSPEARAATAPDTRTRVLDDLDAARSFAPFDAVTAWDVLEHLRDPFEALRTIGSLCRPGAMVAVVVPVIGNINTRIAPRTWDQYKPPEHLWFFSPRAMRDALARYARATVLHEEVAWRRPNRFVDLHGTSTSLRVRALRTLDGTLHRVASWRWPSLTVDSVAFYARVAS